MSDFDVAVVGGGAAGLSAALVLTRARRRVLVVDAGTPRNGPAAHMHGFLSRDGLPPQDLLTLGREEIATYAGQFAHDTVTELRPLGEPGFRVGLLAGGSLTTRRLLVATGLRDVLPEIPGLQERWALDVLHCPYCHGYEVRDKALGVLGWSEHAVGYAQIVRQWSEDVVYFSPPGVLSAVAREQLEARGIVVMEGSVRQLLVQEDRLYAVQLDHGTVSRDALFVPPRFVPNNDLLIELGCEHDDDGWPITHADGRTSVAGVWVAGNVANPRAQVITAAGEGSAAAIGINADLVDEDVRDALSRTASPRGA